MKSSISTSFTDSIRQRRDNELNQAQKMLEAITSVLGGSGIKNIQFDDTVIATLPTEQEDVDPTTQIDEIAPLLNCHLVRLERIGGIPLFGSRDLWTDTEIEGKLDLERIRAIAPSSVIKEHIGGALNTFDAVIIGIPEAQADEFSALVQAGLAIVRPAFKNQSTITYSNGPLKTSYFEKIEAAIREVNKANERMNEAAEKSYVLSQLRQAAKHLILAHDTGLAQQFGLPASILDKVDDWDRLFTEAKTAENAAKRHWNKTYALERNCREALWLKS